MPDTAPHSPDETFDHWLVLRAQSGEEEALRRLYARWAAKLQRHALRMTGSSDGAADASQEAWLAIVRGLGRLEDPACFRRWAYQIVGRKCADWVRRRQRSRATTTPLSEDPIAPTDHESIDRRETVSKTLKHLSSKDQTLLAMHYADEMPLAEIAEAMSLPLGTIKSRLHHARQRLKQALLREDRSTNAKG